jgi:plasmid stabilization system protein ParE
MKIKYHSEARKDFFEAAEYYEKQGVGLGDEFIYEVEKVLDIILQQPFSGRKITSTERRFLTNRFPYGIVYSVENELIKIFAVMDLRRKPSYWKHRT